MVNIDLLRHCLFRSRHSQTRHLLLIHLLTQFLRHKIPRRAGHWPLLLLGAHVGWGFGVGCEVRGVGGLEGEEGRRGGEGEGEGGGGGGGEKGVGGEEGYIITFLVSS